MATLWIVGMMGSGKSTVGPLVARRLARRFVDLDEVVAAAAGRPVAEVFAAEGEPGFRRREAAAVEMVAGEAAVVACGGGVVEGAGNVARMRATGRVAWLDAPGDVLVARVGDGRGRPLLSGRDAAAALESLRAARAGAYAAAADLRVAVAGLSPGEVAAEVVRWWNSST